MIVRCFIILAFLLETGSAHGVLPSAALNALAMVLQRQLTITMCSNPQVFLIPTEILLPNYESQLQKALDNERVATLVGLVRKTDLQYETFQHLHLLMELAALLGKTGDVALLAQVRFRTCQNLETLDAAVAQRTDQMQSKCYLQSFIGAYPMLAAEMSQRALHQLHQAATRFPNAKPPRLRPDTVLVLNFALEFNGLKPLPPNNSPPLEELVWSETNRFTSIENNVYFVPDRSFRYHRDWMDECSLNRPAPVTK
ncbi:MAG: hypothetical protein IT288_06805 [Bdellovibrionales bacterium]|nr:hypothetical protein [Bdellovibrionales bacterium]